MDSENNIAEQSKKAAPKRTIVKKFADKGKNWVVPEENRRLARDTFSLFSSVWGFVKSNSKIRKDIVNRTLEEGKPFFLDYLSKSKNSDKDLDDYRRRFTIESRIMYGAAIFGTAVTAFSFSSSGNVSIFSGTVITFMCYVAGFVRSFRAAQLKHRSLFSFKSWLSMIDDWIV